LELFQDINCIVEVLSNLRTAVVIEEKNLQADIAKLLSDAGITYSKEYRLGPRNRIDFMLENGIGIEVKKGKQNSQVVLNQVVRYAKCDDVTGIIIVSEYNLQLPKCINKKPCETLFLNRLWGIAL